MEAKMLMNLDFCFKPVLRKNGEEKQYGPRFSIFIKPPTDKWWKLSPPDKEYQWDPELDGEWEWGYKCVICGKFFKLLDHRAKQHFKCFAEAFGEVSGMNEMRRLRIAVHSKAGNNAIMPALQAAGIQIRPVSEIKKEMIKHAETHKHEIERRYRQWLTEQFKQYMDTIVREWNTKNEDEFMVYPMEVPRSRCIRTSDAVIFKNAWRVYTVIFKGDVEVRERHDSFVTYCYISLKNKRLKNIRMSKSGKSFIVVLKQLNF
ncbi:hypothetical protein DRP04_00140 [Archaeoglobales archaeon]|nr:MAG: hypothetical protein DRP04_00140 [Archaeoglobales archaeon]